MGEVAAVGAREQESAALPYHGLLLIAGFAAAVVAQGGYYLPGRILSAVMVGVAIVLARPRPNTIVWLGAALALWAVVRGAVAGNAVAGVSTVVAVAVFVGSALVAAKADLAQRRLLATAVVGIGALTAFTGWVGVVFRVPSWSVLGEGLYRASSTLTYPNSAAALLAAAAVLSFALTPHWAMRLAGFVLCTGLVATMSRAGLLALAAGLVVLAVKSPKRTFVVAGPALLGAMVAVGAVLPGVRVADEPQRLVAIAGLVVGAVVALGLPRLGKVAVPVGLALAAVAGWVGFAYADGLTSRVTFTSADRAGVTGSALRIAADQPIFGIGPGAAKFFFNDGNLGTRVMRYVHNEYLQVLVELGGIGLGLTLGVVVAVLVAVWRGRGNPLWGGALGAFVVVLVHSGFDFLWHLPVLLIMAGLCAGLGCPSTEDGTTEGNA